jgi:hypothetical protein
LYHVPEIIGSVTFRSGAASIFFAIGLIVSGLVMAVVAWLALRHQGMVHSKLNTELGEGN